MLQKIGKRLTKNLGLKLLAALSAVILWIVVVNIDDPVKNMKYTTSVNFENKSFIENDHKYFETLGGNNTISFYVSAQRSVHEKLSNTDFVAMADMERIEFDAQTQSWRVPVVVTQTKYSSDKVSIDNKQLYIEVVLEDLQSIQKPIIAESRGTVADGFALGDVNIVGSNILKIAGPVSIVSRIDRVEALVNVDGMSTHVTDSVVPMLYDAEDNVIDTSKLEMSISTVTITAQIFGTKDVALEFLTKGEAADGFMATGIEFQPNTVRIKGEPAVLNPINKITIPEDVLELTGQQADLVTTVDITSYLPEGTSLVLASDAKIDVTVRVEPIISKSFHVPVTSLTVKGLRSGYELEFDERTVAVEIAGPESIIGQMTASGIHGTVDASRAGRGEHDLRVTFELDEEYCSVVEEVTVPVTISGEARVPANNEGNSEGNTGTPDGGTTGNQPEGETGNPGDANAGGNDAGVTEPGGAASTGGETEP